MSNHTQDLISTGQGDNEIDTKTKLLDVIERHIEFRTLVQNMRRSQKRFFKAQPGTLEKVGALKDSRVYEKLVDDILEDKKPENPELPFTFTEQKQQE